MTGVLKTRKHLIQRVSSSACLAWLILNVAYACTLLFPTVSLARAQTERACADWFATAPSTAEVAQPRIRYAPPIWTPEVPRRQSGVMRPRSTVDAMMRLKPALATARSRIVLTRVLEQRPSVSREVYGSNWESRSLGEAIDTLLSPDPRQVQFYSTGSKIYYVVDGRPHYIVEDPAGGYFRVYDVATNEPTSPWAIARGSMGELSEAATHFRSDEPVPSLTIDDETLSICRSIFGPAERPSAGSLNRVRIAALQRCFPALESRAPLERVLAIARESREISWIEPLMAWLESKRNQISLRQFGNYQVLSAEVAIVIDEIQTQHMSPSQLPLHALISPRADHRAEALASLVGVELRARDQELLTLIAANATSVAAIRQYIRIAVARPTTAWENLFARWRTEANSPWGRWAPSAAYEVAHGASAMAAARARQPEQSAPVAPARALAGAFGN